MKVAIKAEGSKKFEYTGEAAGLDIEAVISTLRTLADEWQATQPERFYLDPQQGPLYKDFLSGKWRRYRDLFLVSAEVRDPSGALGLGFRWQTDRPSAGYYPSWGEYMCTEYDENQLRRWYQRVS